MFNFLIWLAFFYNYYLDAICTHFIHCWLHNIITVKKKRQRLGAHLWLYWMPKSVVLTILDSRWLFSWSLLETRMQIGLILCWAVGKEFECCTILPFPHPFFPPSSPVPKGNFISEGCTSFPVYKDIYLFSVFCIGTNQLSMAFLISDLFFPSPKRSLTNILLSFRLLVGIG